MKSIKALCLPNNSSFDSIEAICVLQYPWNQDHPRVTEFKAYHNKEILYFQFKAFGPEPIIFVENNHKLEVRHSERVEIFFRINEEMSPYYVLEIDPLGRLLDYKAEYYRIFDRDWQWPYDLKIETQIHENFYTVSGQFQLDTLRRMELLHGNEIQIGLYRGHCIHIQNGKAEIRWSTWVDPKTSTAEFHLPSSFGTMILENL